MKRSFYRMRATHALAVLIAFLQILGCSDSPTSPPYDIPSDQTLFFERSIVQRAVTIRGEYVGPQPDWENYDYDPFNRTLRGWFDFPLNASLQIIYGEEYIYYDDSSGGRAAWSLGFYTLPGYRYPISILRVDKDGSVMFKHAGLLYSIGVDASVVNQYIRYETTATGSAKLMITETLTNHGFYPKVDIVNWYEYSEPDMQ